MEAFTKEFEEEIALYGVGCRPDKMRFAEFTEKYPEIKKPQLSPVTYVFYAQVVRDSRKYLSLHRNGHRCRISSHHNAMSRSNHTRCHLHKPQKREAQTIPAVHRKYPRTLTEQAILPRDAHHACDRRSHILHYHGNESVPLSYLSAAYQSTAQNRAKVRSIAYIYVSSFQFPSLLLFSERGVPHVSHNFS